MKQRDKMRELIQKFGDDSCAVISAYAAAEIRGEVERKSNSNGIPADAYAAALYRDAIRKNWHR
ncbi:MAG: hypothetical protein JJU00_14200 [Opitutales bacterium]|nr:hypothetical protein [Opitutales bacterium]